MPAKIKNGKTFEELKEQLLQSIALTLHDMNSELSNIDTKLTRIEQRQDHAGARMDSLSDAYVKVEKDLSNHLSHIGWAQIGQVLLELVGFLAIIATLLRAH